jgi:hypothetical protein
LSRLKQFVRQDAADLTGNSCDGIHIYLSPGILELDNLDCSIYNLNA